MHFSRRFKLDFPVWKQKIHLQMISKVHWKYIQHMWKQPFLAANPGLPLRPWPNSPLELVPEWPQVALLRLVMVGPASWARSGAGLTQEMTTPKRCFLGGLSLWEWSQTAPPAAWMACVRYIFFSISMSSSRRKPGSGQRITEFNTY